MLPWMAESKRSNKNRTKHKKVKLIAATKRLIPLNIFKNPFFLICQYDSRSWNIHFYMFDHWRCCRCWAAKVRRRVKAKAHRTKYNGNISVLKTMKHARLEDRHRTCIQNWGHLKIIDEIMKLIRTKSVLLDIYRPFCQTPPPALPAFLWGADPPFPLLPHLRGPPLLSTLHALENKTHYCSVIVHFSFHTLSQYAACADTLCELWHDTLFLPLTLVERTRIRARYENWEHDCAPHSGQMLAVIMMINR